MDAETCAACDCGLEDVVIIVTVRGQQVEVCSSACAQALGEAQASAEADTTRGVRAAVLSGGASHMLEPEARRLPTAAGRHTG
jgi:hypothetical protein